MQPPPAVLRLLESAKSAVRHSAKLLGRVTFCANNHTVQVTSEDGKIVNRTIRDSVDKPKPLRSSQPACGKQVAKPCVKAEQACVVQPWTPPASRRSRSTGFGAAARRAASLEEDRLLRRVHDIGVQLRPSSCRPAAERMAELRRRVMGAGAPSRQLE